MDDVPDNAPLGFWKGAFTTADNKTGDLGRVLIGASFVLYNGFYGFAMHLGMNFDPVMYAAGLAGLHVVGSFGLRVALPTQPSTPGV